MSRIALAPVLAIVLGGGCSDLLLESERVPTSIELSSTLVTAREGTEVPLTVRVLDQNGRAFERIPGWAQPRWRLGSSLVLQDGRLLARAPGLSTATVEVAGLSASATVRVNPTRLRLRVAGAYLTQSIQRRDGSIPLVQGRDAFLRVFLVGDQLNFFAPAVRVHVYHRGALQRTLTLDPGADSIPTVVDEGRLTSSWNVLLPGSLIVPGLSFHIEADPAGAVPLGPGSQLRHPATGSLAPEVLTVPKLWLRLIPIRQTALGTTGKVDSGNLDRYVSELLAMHPIGEFDVDVRAPFSTSSSAATAEGWSQILREIWMLRVADGSRRYYYGLLTAPPSTPYAGLGYLGHPAAIGYDALPGAAGTLAHELGHNFNRYHSPCGGPKGTDPEFPYTDGSIGAFGYDMKAGAIKDPSTERDLMSYCRPRWTSDYTYRAVLDFRRGGDAGTGADVPTAGREEPSLLIWGSLAGAASLIEPAFEITTRPVLPPRPGPYTLEGLDARGAVVFSLPFDAPAIADGPEERQFAFAIPSRIARPDRLAKLRVSSRVVLAERSAIAAAPASPVLRRAPGGGGRLEWEGSRPMALVRDRSGAVIGLVRGGSGTLGRVPAEVEVLISDGLRSSRATARLR